MLSKKVIQERMERFEKVINKNVPSISYERKYLELIEKCMKGKQERFEWLFKKKDSICININETELQTLSLQNNCIANEIIHLLTINSDLKLEELEDRMRFKENMYSFIFQNKIIIGKNTHKLSKFLLKRIKKHNVLLVEKYNTIVKEYNKVVKMLQEDSLNGEECAKLLSKAGELLTCFKQLPTDINTLDFQAFYNDIKAGEVFISIRPEDFILCSTNASFTSCFRVGGEYHEGVYKHLSDRYSFVVRVAINGKLMGRQFIFVDEDNDIIIYGKVYGNINTTIQAKVREFVQKRYVKNKNKINKIADINANTISNRWIKSEAKIEPENVNNTNTYSGGSGGGYFDLFCASKVRLKETGSEFSDLYLDFPDPFNTNGEVYEYNQYDYYCCCCDTGLWEDDIYWFNDECLCPDCYDNNIGTCELCSENEHYDNLRSVNNTAVCPICYDEECSVCDDCGEVCFNDDLTTISGVTSKFVCDVCINDYEECVECGKLFFVPESGNKVDKYCEDCLIGEIENNKCCENAS